MMNQLQPHQISHLWTAIRESVRRASSVGDSLIDEYLNNVLAGLLSGEHQAWMLYRVDEETGERHLYGIFVTSILDDHFYGCKNLYIDHMYAFRKWDGEVINEAWNTLRAFAKNCECASVIAFTNNDKALKIAKRLGFHEITHKVRYNL